MVYELKISGGNMENKMQISARNQMKGKVVDISEGDLLVKIKIEIEPSTVTAVITKDAADTLGIKLNDQVVAIAKATEVMIGK